MHSPTPSLNDPGWDTEHDPRRARFPAWVGLWFAALMVLTVGVRLVDPTGWLGSDDASYYSAAEQVLAGETFHRIHHHYGRMAVILPVAASIHLFGESPATVALPMFLASIACVALVAVLGWLVWGWWEGLCAATIVAVLPYFRVLSTTAAPDVHACLWVTAAMVLAIAAARGRRTSAVVALALACGLATGLAVSAKVFSITVCVGVVAIVLTTTGRARRRGIVLSSAALGGLVFFVAHGLFYVWAADDFWYKLHALTQAQSNDRVMPAAGGPLGAGYAALAWDRLTMILRPATSGWGLAAIAFWPAALLTLFACKKGRPIALWAIVTYLAVALMPVSFRNGPQPYPLFHGRHVLIACVPFALCLAWTIRRAILLPLSAALRDKGERALETLMRWAWPAVAAIIVVAAFENPRELSGYRDRSTKRIGDAVAQIAQQLETRADRDIFMPPSLYLRYRILFPPTLRARLRVAAAADAPTWWRDACVDVVSRRAPLADPQCAYLVATPSQLNGKPEFWDYGVTLPQPALLAWQQTTPITTIARFRDRTVGPAKRGEQDVHPLLLLLAEDWTVTKCQEGTRHDTTVG